MDRRQARAIAAGAARHGMRNPPGPPDRGSAVSIGDDLAADPLALVDLALALAADGQPERALDLIEAASARPDADPLLAQAHGALLARSVADYHQRMLADRPRNAAFAAGLAAAELAGQSVLDIGSGSGLLAMIAARAGAARVVSCERVPSVAETARRIVAANGLAGKVRVVTGQSTRLSVEELGGPFDVIVSEILAQDVVLEGVLPALADAHRRLAAPGARFLPLSATIRVAAARFTRPPPVGLADVEGFDLTAFERHFTPPLPERSGHRLQLVGEPADAILFDFNDPAHLVARRGTLQLNPSAEPADGIAQWIAIDFPGGVRFENPPGTPSAWGVNLIPFERPAEAGEPIALGWWVQQDMLRIWRQ
jgi:protein arginine N-methyltransferase 7